MLTKEEVVDRVEVTEDGHVQVRKAMYVLENGVRIAGPMYHRSIYAPGAEVDPADTKVAAIAEVVWTPEVVTAYRDKQEAQAAAMEQISPKE